MNIYAYVRIYVIYILVCAYIFLSEKMTVARHEDNEILSRASLFAFKLKHKKRCRAFSPAVKKKWAPINSYIVTYVTSMYTT